MADSKPIFLTLNVPKKHSVRYNEVEGAATWGERPMSFYFDNALLTDEKGRVFTPQQLVVEVRTPTAEELADVWGIAPKAEKTKAAKKTTK